MTPSIRLMRSDRSSAHSLLSYYLVRHKPLSLSLRFSSNVTKVINNEKYQIKYNKVPVVFRKEDTNAAVIRRLCAFIDADSLSNTTIATAVTTAPTAATSTAVHSGADATATVGCGRCNGHAAGRCHSRTAAAAVAVFLYLFYAYVRLILIVREVAGRWTAAIVHWEAHQALLQRSCKTTQTAS
jgi:hypothetical protein